MDKGYFQYYNNRKKGLCNSPTPFRLLIVNYLIKENYLSEYSSKEEIDEVLNNLTITEKLDGLRNLITARVIEAEGVSWDLIPTLGHYDYALSSDALYKIFLNYYNKQEVEDKITEIWNLLVDNELTIEIDSELSTTSTNPVQNKVIALALSELLSQKANVEDLDDYYTKLEINSKLANNEELTHLKDVLIPQMLSDIASLLLIINTDNLDITEVIEKYLAILSFIQSLNGDEEGQEVLNSIIEGLSSIEENLLSEISRAKRTENSLSSRISTLEDVYENISALVSIYSIVTELEAGLMSSLMLIDFNNLKTNYLTVLNELNEIKQTIELDDISIILKFNRIAEFLELIQASEGGQALLDDIISIINTEQTRALEAERDLLLQINTLNTAVLKNEVDIRNLSISGTGEKTKHIFLTELEYTELEEYEDALYFILEPQEGETWGFGGKFPITLS